MGKRKNNREIKTNYNAAKIAYLKKVYSNCSIPVERMRKKLGIGESTIYSLAFRLGLKRRNYWTTEEDEYLKDSYNNKADVSMEDISKKLNGHSISSIKKRIHSLGLYRFERVFTQIEIDFILNAKHLSIKDIANHLGVRINNIKHFLAKDSEKYEITEVKKGKWTPFDDAYLKTHYPNYEIPLRQITTELGRSLDSVRIRASILGIKRERIDLWTEEEDEYLKINYENKDIPMEQIFEHLNHRSQKDVYKRSMKLGLKRTSFKLSQGDIDFIINQKEWRIKDIAAHLGISISTVNYYLAKNNVKRNVGGKKGTWTNQQKEYLKIHYPDKSFPMEAIMEYLGRSYEAINYQANILNLSRPLSNK